MRASDLDAVVAIERATFPTPWTRGIFIGELLQGESRRWTVVTSPTGILGYSGSMQAGDESHVMNLAVRADARGSGLGAAMLADLMSDAARRGVARMTLEVRPSNASAIALYEAAGFHAAGERPGYYSDTGEPALIMWTDELDSKGMRERIRELSERGLRSISKRAGSAVSPAGGPRRALVLAIESSCDETAASVVRGGHEVLSSVVASQVDFHSRFGGVVPEIASRKHTEAIVGVVDQALTDAGVGLGDLDAIGVTYGPGLVGALVVGVAYAKGLALATGLPLVGVNHLEGHLFANNLADPTVEPPLVALIVSGGHTSLVHVPAWGIYHTLGSTLDDAAGEAFDKVAKLLGLGYPGGPAISSLAKMGDPAAIAFPRAMINSGDYDFSLSGLKTAVLTYVDRERKAGREIHAPDLAASFQAAVIDVQVFKAVRAAEEFGVTMFCLAGGVAANPALRDALRVALAAHGVRLSVPPFELCTDNAAMIAAAANFRFLRGERLGLDAEAVPDLSLS